MTNGELLWLFKRTFPNADVLDASVPDVSLLPKNKLGLTIWLTNGDVLMWFPNLEKGEERDDDGNDFD